MNQPYNCINYYFDGRPLTQSEWESECEIAFEESSRLRANETEHKFRYALTNPLVVCPECGKHSRPLTMTTIKQ